MGTNAEAWLNWARSPDSDHAFWRLNMPALIELLPPPGGLTLDIGCGEGRLARELRRLGYRVVGLENSPSLAAAAREADPGFEVVIADAAEMPMADDSFDLVIASLVLMNMDDMNQSIAEISRVLETGGTFCFSVLHPVNTWVHTAGASYFETIVYEERVEQDGEEMTFHDTHRPLSAYFAALQSAGFLVECLREPMPDEAYAASHGAAERWRHWPGFLYLRAVLSGSG